VSEPAKSTPSLQQTWPALPGVQHAFVQVAQARIHYAETGRGEPLILLHGWPQHGWCYRHLLARLSQHHRVICPDIRGLGWSDYAGDRYDLLSLAADLTAFMDALAIPQARLVGHDWGAAIGYVACLHWPARISKFAALGALTPWSGDVGALRLALQVWHVFVLALFGRLALRALSLPQRALRRWTARPHFSPHEEAVYLERMQQPDARRATAHFYASIVRRDVPFFVRHASRFQLRTPTLHINGEHDPLTRGVVAPPKENAPCFTLRSLSGSGHFLAEEQPDALCRELLAFFLADAPGSELKTARRAARA
jgi:pimeloyl-ACP methyl ester carboxylesterase